MASATSRVSWVAAGLAGEADASEGDGQATGSDVDEVVGEVGDGLPADPGLLGERADHARTLLHRDGAQLDDTEPGASAVVGATTACSVSLKGSPNHRFRAAARLPGSGVDPGSGAHAT